MLRARLGEKCSCQDEADSKQRRCLKLMEPLGRIIRRIESGVKKALKHHIITITEGGVELTSDYSYDVTDLRSL